MVHRFIARSGRKSRGPTLLREAHGRQDYGDRGEPPIDPFSSERGRQSHRGGVSSRDGSASKIGWRILVPRSMQLDEGRIATSTPESLAGVLPWWVPVSSLQKLRAERRKGAVAGPRSV